MEVSFAFSTANWRLVSFSFSYIFVSSLGMVSYDDERSICEKTDYAMKNDLRGYVSCTASLKKIVDVCACY